MIQDIASHTLNNRFDPAAAPEGEDCALFFEDGRVLLREGLRIPRVKDFPGCRRWIYLFSVDDARFFLADGEKTAPEGCAPWGMRDLCASGEMPKELLFAILTGKHLWDWYRDTRFCGRCGGTMAHARQERAMECPACGYTAYPRIMPAVIAGVKNGDYLLLTRYRTGIAYNALIAGFTEIGETAEQTVAREVMEEAGVRVKNITYYKSQPWGIANDLLMGFYCDLVGDPNITMDEGELKYAAWVRREEIELQPDDLSLTNEMMRMFKTGEVR